MEGRTREVWKDVEVHLELSLEFDPEAFGRLHPGLALILAELMVGGPRIWRDPVELLPFAGKRSLEAHLPHLRFSPLETKRLAKALDHLFTAIEFDIVGHKVLRVPPVSKLELPEHWRNGSSLWLCHQPLAS